MSIKPKHKHYIFWTIVALIGLTIIGILCIPPFINLNKMKPVLESKLYEQTGVITKINGDVNFSLLGHATIVAHNIQIPTGQIDTISFSVPLTQMFNLQKATLNKQISVNNANIKITDLFPYSVSHDIFIYNASLNFMGHDYRIVRGVLSHNKFAGQVRTSQHKYDITYDNGEFVVLNSNDNLHIRGTLFPDGGAAGEMSIATNDINKWFEFENPKINEPVGLSMEFNWDGEYGFDFSNIHANNYTGNIKLLPSGLNSIEFKSNNANIDMTFIAYDHNMLNKTDMNFDLSGKIKFKNNTLSRFKIIAAGRDNKLELNYVAADDIELFGGTYDEFGLHNTKLQINNLPEKFSCDFDGTPQKWECKKYTYGNITGNITVDNGIFNITATSTDKMPSTKTLRSLISHIGDSGTIDFTFSDMSGVMVVTPKQMFPKFRYAKNVTMRDVDVDLDFLPEFMSNTRGIFSSGNTTKKFIPENQQWMIDISGNQFTITGINFKQWLPNIDLRFLNDMPYAISGTYSNQNISDLNIIIAGQILSGVVSKSGLTLKTPVLNLDKFINKSFKDNFQEQKFLANHPIATLFEIPSNISLSADTLILDNQEYKNFVYSLKPDTQVFSISDSDRGHLLAIIEKEKFNYDISIQVNKFKIDGEFLDFNTPLNITDSVVTAEINLHTSGQTANDLIYNLNGDVDITFSGGTINGLGFDRFYANADNLNILNAEYILSSALESGDTELKKLKIQGVYNNGNFETTRPLTLSMHHIDAVGALFINDKIMTGTFEFVLRGTAPKPASIELNIDEYGKRNYSISQIINNLDIGYMRAFVKQNKKF